MSVVLFAALALGSRWYTVANPLPAGPHHTRHFELYGKDASRYGRAVLKGVDKVQATAPDGGGYFTGVKAVPAESPVGYPIALQGYPLLAPPRATSYCSGSSYAALIEGLNEILAPRNWTISPDRIEAMRMQEPDGGRREDFVKVWGTWNADGPGSEYALVQYTGMGERIRPDQARPGDFMNVAWKSGIGHSVVFLGWCHDAQGRKSVVYWSSQKGTNGYGDQVSPIDSIASVVIVRLTHPERVYSFDPAQKIDRNVPGDPIAW